MNWEEVGAIGQVLGSLAVFITLVYLASQVRHARQETRRSISQGRAASSRELAIHRASSEQLNSIYSRAIRALGSQQPHPFIVHLMERARLTQEEATGLFWDQYAFWNHRQVIVSYVDDLTPGERAEFESGIRASYAPSSPIGHLWYEHSKANINPDAVCYVDNLLAQPG